MEPSEQNKFTLAAMTAVLVNNDFHYMHFLAKGKDFDKSHNLAQEYYTKIEDEIDYLMELCLEVGAPIYNYTKAGEIIPEYQPEDKVSYDYSTLIECLKDKIQTYTITLRNLRNATDNDSIQSRLDDMLRDWEKELYYKLVSRTETPATNVFINTGLDVRVAGLNQYNAD